MKCRNRDAEAVRQAGISEQTYYRWRKQYGGMNTSDAKRIKELEKEHARLKRLVAEECLESSVFKNIASHQRWAAPKTGKLR